jgi:glutathione S-transferase
MSLRLHVFPPSPRAFKVMAAANYLGLAWDLQMVHLFQGDQDRPDYVALNPNRRMPVLEDDGFVLWESNAILQYLAAKAPEARLGPASAREQAEINRWQFWDLAHWEPAANVLLDENVKKPALMGQAPDPAEVARGEAAFHACAEILEPHLREHAFVACDRLTVADFSLGAYTNLGERIGLPLTPYPEIRAWRERLTQLPAWRDTLAQSTAHPAALPMTSHQGATS